MKHLSEWRFVALIVVCIGVNLGIGFVVTAVKLPFYLDSIGTVLATGLGGLWAGMACGLLSMIVGSTYTPTLWAYAGTVVAIALYVWLVLPFGYLSRLLPTLLFGLGLGVVCAIASAPVTAYVWKGVSWSGADALTAFFSAQGQTLLISVLLGALVTDPVDKLLTSLVAFAALPLIGGTALRNAGSPVHNDGHNTRPERVTESHINSGNTGTETSAQKDNRDATGQVVAEDKRRAPSPQR